MSNPETINAIRIKCTVSPTGFKCINAEPITLPADTEHLVTAIQDEIGGYFESHYCVVKRKKLSVFVDEEAMLKPDIKLGFILGTGRPLFGDAIVMGIPNLRADETDCPLDAKTILKHITMITRN